MPATVMLVEDEAVSLQLMTMFLEEESYVLIIESDPLEAFDIYKEKSDEIDLVVTDISMPGMSGVELIRKCREINNDLECIVVTGHRDIKHAISAMQEGAGNYLLKPVTKEILVLAVKRGLERLRLYRELEAKKESELRQAMREHSGKMAALGEMSSAMAHEINQPLSVINITIQTWEMLYKKGKLNVENVINELGTVKKNLHRVVRQIEHVRKLSHTSREIKPTNIRQVIDDALSLCRIQFNKHNITIHENYPEEILMAMADANELEQVFLNLFSNARYSIQEKNKIERNFAGEVFVSMAVKGDRLVVKVADNGIGISESIRAKIFTPFVTNKPKGQGTGLGLHIATRILEKVDGEIYLEDADIGASFVVLLPLLESDDKTM